MARSTWRTRIRCYSPSSIIDDRLDGKKRVHGVIGERPAEQSAPVTVYVIDEFDRSVELVEDAVGPHEIIIAGASDPGFTVAFR